MFNITHIEYNIETYKNLVFKIDGKSVHENKDKIAPFFDKLEIQLKEYVHHQKNLENLVPLSKSCSSYDWSIAPSGQTTNNSHTQLYKLYDTNIKLKKDIKRHTINQAYVKKGLVCPYCGIKRNYTRDLDHYIPRESYPEFSIMTNNLIFSCSTCNQHPNKGIKFLDSNGKRMILNPYFDECLKEEILLCRLSNSGINLNITFSINLQLQQNNPDLYITACHHLNELGLHKRYANLCEDIKDTFIEGFCNPKIKTHREIEPFSIDDAQTVLSLDIKRLERTSHPNNFELIFLKELKNCTAWLSAISGQIIK